VVPESSSPWPQWPWVRRRRWALVVDTDGRLLGWVDPGDISGATAGLDRVADHIRTFEATVPADASLKAAFAEMLQHDAGWVAVLDGERYLGVLTPDTLHAALRRSVGGEPVIV
jgi:osmoprotectant transport system ATP-binding protein